MAYALTRTSMALDQFTLRVLDSLAKKWGVPKAEVMRRAVRRIKEEEDMKEQAPKPLKALDWLQKGGGLTVKEAEAFREEVQAEREAKRYWWEA
jgi:Arc/MetJ-type ribon-helix-helix transcriptional regulator